ncbi:MULTISPECIES: DUF2784 domain-containing protein [unclassified Oceanispirochaeta]|uniref:DUF2784 domain-containing protein n=1 Tax=unclassified Oceanispirochaeta TaxID=2635722 RepID=UPI000E094511|nr:MULTISPECIES: DUF2784 domain-containing protein [unclassified Oceanispirochaeta]RDG32895.1 DUF2784 domain-containing protein [Oceanispirochaeta sp. M1]
MIWAFIADFIVFIHFLYVFFTVFGELLILIGGLFKWHWVKNRIFRITHLIAVLFVTLESMAGILCPLTQIEYEFRRRAGQVREDNISFVGRLIRKFIFYDFPEIFFILLYVGFGLMVILTFLFIPISKKRKQIM